MNAQELTTTVRDIEKTVSAHDECIKDHGRQISEVRAEVKEQGKLLQSIDRLAMGLTRLDEKMGDLSCKIDTFGNRIGAIELKPARKWEAVSIEIIKYIVLAGIGYLAATFLKGV